MKITTYRNVGETQTQRTVELETALEAIRTEIKSRPVSALRDSLAHTTSDRRNDFANKLPVWVFGGVFNKKEGRQELIAYNGLIMLEINKLAHPKEAKQLRDLASKLPQTLVAFVGSSGRSVKIIVPFTLPDGSLPQKTELIRWFHAQAYKEAVKWYQPQMKREIELKKPVVERGCRLSFDPDLYYNPRAAAIHLEQPLRMPAETTYEEAQQTISDPLQRLLPGYERNRIISTLFDTCLVDALEKVGGVDWQNDELKPFFIKLAENCYQSGIPEEEAVKWTLLHRGLKKYDIQVRANFRSTYSLGKKLGGKPCISSSMTLVAQLDEFMQRRYQLRYNTIKATVEYRELKSFYFDFRPLTKQAMNSISLNATAEGINAWDADIKRYLYSDRVPVHNPIEDYLFSLPVWDGKDRIRKLASCIKCKNDRWGDLFYTWFLSMVAHWQQIDHRHANSTLPLLVGNQGCGKSTFCLNLLPPELRDYYTDSIDFSNRRNVELALGRFALINMDEFDSISPSYQGFMKHILQKAVVQTRLPYAGTTEAIRRYATFIATSNNFDLLSDPTGNRRFICVEVEGIIDYTQPIDYSQLYAQAIHAIRNNERYWFTHEEEAYITSCNQRFLRTMPEEEMIHTYFRAPANGESCEELTCAQMLERIRMKHPGFKYTRTVAITLGRSLKSAFDSRRMTKGTVYKVVEILA
ncbi:BT4734/BF3469 family protein [Bacteroides sp. 224]|uniref:BT4734/BF3469 family protein n=1 Tax=Bacteroides sp. 224 TaxID=2302936 RepID=UPI0013D5955E|nr:BT4734/BF3469 family protein [Bacteroides sp. 224]NDV63661.1 hypothetical protein [Bacteroides sp. 224]